MDQFIDIIEGNRKYIKCLYVYNKIDVMGMDDVDRLSRLPNSVVISCSMQVRPRAPPARRLPLGLVNNRACRPSRRDP